MPTHAYTLITGASDGLGKAFALECAQRGRNLILVALPGKKLRYLADFIRRNFQVKVTTFAKDLSKEEDCIDLYREVQQNHLKVDLLINNVGLGNCASFETEKLDYFLQLIRINILPATILTRLFLDQLKEQPDAHVLNVSSLGAYFNLPNKQVYGATKAYLLHFSKSLRLELAPTGVSVSVLCPGGMNTNPRLCRLLSTSNWFVRHARLSPEQVAAIAINATLAGKAVIIPGRLNRISLILDKILPTPLKRFCTGRLMNRVTNPSITRKITSHEQQVNIPAVV
jgi:short-subunit dehydrogenase